MRQPKLRKKKIGNNVYWYTEANGGAYFGKVGEVPYPAARRSFGAHLDRTRTPSRDEVTTIGGVFSLFLAWVKENRSAKQYDRRRRDCSRFCRLEWGGRRVADIDALEVTGPMLEAWRNKLRVAKAGGDPDAFGLDPQSLLHAETSVRHAFNWATKHPGPKTLLPVTFRPFGGVERTRPPRKALTEADLLDSSEVKGLLEAAAHDIDQFRRWGIEAHIAKHGREEFRPCKDSFADILRVFYATGARTGELAKVKVGDFLPRSRQLVLGDHKRSATEKVATVRHITLNDEALEIVRRLCAGRERGGHVFTTRDGKAWDPKKLNMRLHVARRVSAALGQVVREGTTIYDFRHLWISEALMAGVDLMTVARMAGTSVRMIETVYGHFRRDHYDAAQKLLDRQRSGILEGPG